MTSTMIVVACSVIGIALGLTLGIFAMRRMGTSKRWRSAGALAIVLLSAFAFYVPRDRDIIQDSERETQRKKGDKSGDPPVPET